jgi:hypothetical protein
MKAQRWIAPANRRVQGGALGLVGAAHAVGQAAHVASRER